MNLRERIRTSGLKLGWIADQIGVHKTTVRRWKNRGMQPKPEAREKLEALLFAEHRKSHYEHEDWGNA